jgi:hypothetical protein
MTTTYSTLKELEDGGWRDGGERMSESVLKAYLSSLDCRGLSSLGKTPAEIASLPPRLLSPQPPRSLFVEAWILGFGAWGWNYA